MKNRTKTFLTLAAFLCTSSTTFAACPFCRRSRPVDRCYYYPQPPSYYYYPQPPSYAYPPGVAPPSGAIPSTGGDFQTMVWGGRSNVPLKRVQAVLMLTSKDRFANGTSRAHVCESVRTMMEGYLQMIVDQSSRSSSEPRVVLLPTIVLDGEGDRARPHVAKAIIESLSIEPTDSLIFMYSGHGATDQFGRHFLTMSSFANATDKKSQFGDEILFHSDLRKWVTDKRAGLSVILTSSCANEIPLLVAPAPQAPAAVPVAGLPLTPARDLFLMHRGLVDINGCDRDEVTVSKEFIGSLGGILSPSSSDTSLKLLDNLVADRFIEWMEAFPVWRERANESYLAAGGKASEGMHPFPFFLPGREYVGDR